MKTLNMAEAKSLLSQINKAIEDVKVSDVQFPKRFGFSVSRIQNSKFFNVDFNSPVFRKRMLSKGQFLNCDFKDVCFDGLGAYGLTFKDVTFGKSVFSRRLMGFFQKCEFVDVEICQSKIGETSFKECNFSEFAYRGNENTKAIFEECSFSSSIFEGSLIRANFIRCKMNNIDLRKSALREIIFVDCCLESIFWPEEPNCFAINNFELSRRGNELKGIISEKGYTDYCWLVNSHPRFGVSVLDDSFFGELPKEDTEIALKYFYDLRVGRT